MCKSLLVGWNEGPRPLWKIEKPVRMLNSLCITPNFYRHEGCAVIWFKTTLTTQRENTLRLMRWFTWSKLILIKWIRSSLMKSDNDNKTLIKTDRDNVWFVQTDKTWCLIRHQLFPPLIPLNVHVFLIFHRICENITFSFKIMKNLQILKGCKYATRLRNDMCDTAFESLDVIVFDMIIFGYYSGTQNTQNPTYVRHLK